MENLIIKNREFENMTILTEYLITNSNLMTFLYDENLTGKELIEKASIEADQLIFGKINEEIMFTAILVDDTIYAFSTTKDELIETFIARQIKGKSVIQDMINTFENMSSM